MSIDYQDALRTQHYEESREPVGIIDEHQFSAVHGPAGFFAARCDCGVEFVSREARGIDEQHEAHLERVLDEAEADLFGDDA